MSITGETGVTGLPDPKTIKALVLDLDGTLLAPGPLLSERSVRAVKACLQKGLQVIIATGRAIEGAEPFRAALTAIGPMIYFNGAVVADMPGGEIINITLLDKKAAEFCVGLSREMGVYYQVFFPPGYSLTGAAGDLAAGKLPAGCKKNKIILMTEKEGPERDMYHNHTGILAELGDLKEALGRPGLEGCVKGMFLAEPDVMALVRPRLAEHFGGSVGIVQAYRTFLEIVDAKVSKGQGLKLAMERSSLKREEVLAFGDEENDLSVFAEAGFSAAPSNAKDSVRAEADLVIGSNTEDGVAAFLEEFFGL